ncbi:hypothetical protein D3C71_481150 [compost metagenome]
MKKTRGGLTITRKDPGVGTAWEFFDIVRQSGMKNVVSTNNPPRIRLHDGEGDYAVQKPGITIFLVSSRGLPEDPKGRAAAVLRRLAADDWAANEIIARQDRHEELLRTGYFERKPKITYGILRVRRYLRQHPEAALDEISEATGVPHDEILESGELQPDVGDAMPSPSR